GTRGGVELRLGGALPAGFIDRPLAAALRGVDQRLAVGRELETALDFRRVRDALGSAAVHTGHENVAAIRAGDFLSVRRHSALARALVHHTDALRVRPGARLMM